MHAIKFNPAGGLTLDEEKHMISLDEILLPFKKHRQELQNVRFNERHDPIIDINKVRFGNLKKNVSEKQSKNDRLRSSIEHFLSVFEKNQQKIEDYTAILIEYDKMQLKYIKEDEIMPEVNTRAERIKELDALQKKFNDEIKKLDFEENEQLANIQSLENELQQELSLTQKYKDTLQEEHNYFVKKEKEQLEYYNDVRADYQDPSYEVELQEIQLLKKLKALREGIDVVCSQLSQDDSFENNEQFHIGDRWKQLKNLWNAVFSGVFKSKRVEFMKNMYRKTMDSGDGYLLS